MALALLMILGAAALGLAAAGSLEALAAVPLKGLRLLAVVVVAQLLGGGLVRLTNLHGFYPAGLAVSALAGLAFCLRNRSIAGIGLVTVGLLANALVVCLNGSMPVSAHAAARAGVPLHTIVAGDDARHSVAGPGTTWQALGDVIPVALPWRPEVASPGDALIAAGLGEYVLIGMRPRRRRPRRRPPNTQPPSGGPPRQVDLQELVTVPLADLMRS